MRIKLKTFAAIIFFLAFCSGTFAQNSNEGCSLFEQNKPAEAIAFLEADIAGGNPLPQEYNYLGLAYYQIGNYEKSVEAFKKGTSASGTNKKLLYFNMGNSYFAMKKWQEALDAYSMASVADPTYAEPVLNKAGVELKLDKLLEAAADYKRFLVLKPEDEQRPQIEKLLALIEGELSARAASAGASFLSQAVHGCLPQGFGSGQTGGRAARLQSPEHLCGWRHSYQPA